jgi:small conductance mechanosensitive channel
VDPIRTLLTVAAELVPLLAAIVVVTIVVAAVRWALRRRWRDDPGAQFRFQLIMLALTLAGFLAVIVALPISDSLRGQLLSLIGILLSAAIALSSTTFIGNIMAGIMLKALRKVRPGCFITVGGVTGRVTEMNLLHAEVQTEFRDLITVPCMYMVTQPLQIVRPSGTIITAEVSLGYDVAYQRIFEVLREAAEQAGLKDGFVQVRELGDFSITYRVAGLLEDVDSLISARSRLREAMLDALHGADIEVVSPTFMLTRQLGKHERFIPEPVRVPMTGPATSAEEVAFDIAEEAASIEKLRKAIERIEAELASEERSDAEKGDLEARKTLLVEQLKAAEKQREAEKLTE